MVERDPNTAREIAAQNALLTPEVLAELRKYAAAHMGGRLTQAAVPVEMHYSDPAALPYSSEF